MPNLFPEDVQGESAIGVAAAGAGPVFGKSWRFNFSAGEFVTSASGQVGETSGVDAWLEWCRKALATERYRSLVYGRSYGSEFEALIARHLPRAANFSEIKRIASETLLADRRTAKVDSFAFRLEGDACYFTCKVENVRGAGGTVAGKVAL